MFRIQNEPKNTEKIIKIYRSFNTLYSFFAGKSFGWIIEIKRQHLWKRTYFMSIKKRRKKEQICSTIFIVNRVHEYGKWSIKMNVECALVEPEQLNLTIKQLHWAFNVPIYAFALGSTYIDSVMWHYLGACGSIFASTPFRVHITLNYKFLEHEKQI